MKKSILLACTAITLLFSCSDDDSTIETSTAPVDNTVDENNQENNQENTVQLVANNTFGNILTDSNGRSLYFFSKDTKEISECTGGCKDVWPVFYTADLTLDNGLNAADFGEITREDGDKQTTYKGWPLYYFSNDNEAGDTNGDGVGNTWYIAKPDYTVMYAQAKVTDEEDATFYMTNDRGRTIYLFSNDTKDTNNFTQPNFSNNAVWPIISLDLKNVPSILSKEDFGMITVQGRNQITYKGWPLYYFGSDVERGDVNGVSPTWPIVNTDTPVAPIAAIAETRVEAEQVVFQEKEETYAY